MIDEDLPVLLLLHVSLYAMQMADTRRSKTPPHIEPLVVLQSGLCDR